MRANCRRMDLCNSGHKFKNKKTVFFLSTRVTFSMLPQLIPNKYIYYMERIFNECSKFNVRLIVPNILFLFYLRHPILSNHIIYNCIINVKCVSVKNKLLKPFFFIIVTYPDVKNDFLS